METKDGKETTPCLSVSKALYFIDVTSDLMECRGEETGVYNNPVKC